MTALEKMCEPGAGHHDEGRAGELATDINELPGGYYYSPRIISTFVGISLSLIATYFAFEASASAISNINADIGPSENASLASTVWTVSQSISILIMGRLTDRFGRRNFVLATGLIGLIGGIVACTAQNFNTLIGAQVLLGLAAGQPGSYLLLVGELMSNKTKFLGIVSVAFPSVVGTGFAPYFGQKLGTSGNWRWIFYIYIILIVVSNALLFIFYHPPSFVQLHGKRTSKREELRKTDWIGIFLLTAGLALFLLGISWGGSPQPWNSPRILGLLISGAATCVAFVLYECFGSVQYPIVPMKLFRDIRGFSCLVIISAVMGIMNVALFIMWPGQVVHIFGTSLDTEQTSWMTATATLSMWAGILILGTLFHIVKHSRVQLIIGSIWVTAFLGSMSSVTESNKASAIAFSMLASFVIGWGEDVTMLLAQCITPDHELGVAFAVVASSRTIFGSIFTAAFVAIYTNKLPGKFQQHLVPAVLNAGLPKSSIGELLTAVSTSNQQAIAAVPGMTDALLKITNKGVADSYAASYAYVYYFALALGVVSILAAACAKDFDPYLTDHVARQIYHKRETGTDALDSDSSTENEVAMAVPNKAPPDLLKVPAVA
ncbi:fungal trichothecene efflux pump [Aspergillus alliaceus]|uniref:Fungal trichothecene efflux pump n=1 Tax=Petromyces alliaceus TaxID=209559 RepID=A0A5N7CRV6_PETAA|nr:fungal trichothecene efflux pump [Aspergillus alliaceus]